MNIDVRAVHFDLSEANRAYLDKKLERIAYAKDLIVDLLFSFTKEKQFKCECRSPRRKSGHRDEQEGR